MSKRSFLRKKLSAYCLCITAFLLRESDSDCLSEYERYLLEEILSDLRFFIRELKIYLAMAKMNIFAGSMPEKTRGVLNCNPFNIRKSHNSWRGKLRFSSDKDFEQFTSIAYGLRAGFLLLRNGYLAKGFDTPVSILYRYAPLSDDNDTSSYVRFVCSTPVLEPTTKISVNSLTFFYLCQKMLYFESHFVLSLEIYEYIVKRFKLW